MITTSYKEFENFSNENQFQSLDQFLKIYEQQKNDSHFNVEEIPFKKLDQWRFDVRMDQKFKQTNWSLYHESGKFFRIDGVRVKTNYNNIQEWTQPIINQPEIGILGIITKIFNNTRYYLMQLKMEPGNINILQLSPTVQATKSNFSQVHKGKSVLFLEYFINKSKSKILIDQLQSEQGGRFLRKRNRNMIVEISDDIQIPENFFWLTLSDIKELLRIDNFVNMDARSVIATIPLPISFAYPIHADEEIIRWYVDQKVKYELETERIPISELDTWRIDSYKIFNIINPQRYFSVIALKIEMGNREISSWTQPMIKDLNYGCVGLIVKNFKGVAHYLFQTKVMPGNIDIIDLSPTVSISNSFMAIQEEAQPIFVKYFTNLSKKSNINVIYSNIQSEEGGRFYHFQNRNMIVEIPENEELDILDNYMWITYNQMAQFIPRGMFNIESRSLIAAINFI